MQSEQHRLSTNSSGSVDIGLLLKKYKQANTKLSPLPLEQFEQVALDNKIDLLQQLPDNDLTQFLGFKELNQGAVSELKRSLLQSKRMWNNYSQSLFTEEQSDQPKYYTSRKMQLIHNRDTFRQIKEKYKKQEETQIEEVRKYFQKIQSKSPGVKSYPSMQYQDLQRIEQIRRQIRQGNQSELITKSKDAEQLQRRLNESLINEIKIKKQCVYIYKDTNLNWQPCSRNASTMLSYDHKLYLYGGAGSKQTEDLCYANIDKQKYKWNQIKFDEKSSNGYRGNHSAAIYKNLMIIFGGEVHQIINDKRISSEITSDIKIINLITNELKVLKQTGIIPPRKCHVAEVIGRNMIVQGGIDLKGQYLRDVISYDIATQRWSQVLTEQHVCFPDGVAFHKSCAVFHNTQVELYKNDPEVKFNYQGVFIFGGFDKHGHYLDKLIKIDITTKPINFEQVQTKGLSPIGRCQHSMNYLEQYQIIVIYGGKNDDLNVNGFLNDIHLLDMKTLTWINVEIKGSQVAGRCGHSAACIESKLYIFGGCNYSGFLKSDLLIIELDPIQAQQFGQQDVIYEKPRKSQLKVTFKKQIQKDHLTEIKEKIDQICLKPQKQSLFLPKPRRLSDLLNSLNLKELIQPNQQDKEKDKDQQQKSSRSSNRQSPRKETPRIPIKNIKRTMTTIVNSN
ncbi:unnamed protein product [Paramecium pentaurelia]|uniref:Kelch motif family protein n=1 Tax=Paramecium pentaurelia TaxID=43138 RepID=A0A8S1TLL5_9CILI|nr:unnamed protein product [Paramecium pentaurelia]